MHERREFIRRIAVACTALASSRCEDVESPTGPSLSPPRPEPAMVRLPLMGVGQTVGATLGGESLAVTRLTDTTVVAVSRTCTHQGCTVLLPGAAQQTLDCPCHGSRFTTSGVVVNGPAARPLRRFATRINGADVVVAG